MKAELIESFESGQLVKHKAWSYKKGVNDDTFYEMIRKMPDPEPFKIGEYIFAHYYNPNKEIELYFAKLLSIGDNYCKATLFAGEELYPDRIYGTYNDVCIGDIRKIQVNTCFDKTLELVLENRKQLGFKV